MFSVGLPRNTLLIGISSSHHVILERPMAQHSWPAWDRSNQGQSYYVIPCLVHSWQVKGRYLGFSRNTAKKITSVPLTTGFIGYKVDKPLAATCIIAGRKPACTQVNKQRKVQTGDTECVLGPFKHHPFPSWGCFSINFRRPVVR